MGVSDEVIFARELVALTRTEAEALIRFAAEFVYRAKYAPATPEGLAAAYGQTVPAECADEDVHVFIQDLAEQVHLGLGEDFKDWARRKVAVQQLGSDIADLRSDLARVNPLQQPKAYQRMFGKLVELEQQRRQAAGSAGFGLGGALQW